MSIFFHIDLDAFYASVELIDNPALAGKPVIVGGTNSLRGVVSTCSYEARKFGVHSAMPVAEARRLCPQAVFLPVRMSRYLEMSSRVMAIFGEYTPDFVRVSIDEASLDMSGTERLWGPPASAAASIQSRVLESTGLSISIGIAANRYVAKLASSLRKPAGLVIVEQGTEATFMLGLRLKDLWGAGPKTRARLEELGIDTVKRLAGMSASSLVSLFGKAGGEFLHSIARGVDPGIYAGETASMSISTETTFEKDVSSRHAIESTLMAMSEELVARLLEQKVSSRCAVLKIRYDDFETVSIRETRPVVFSSSTSLYDAALSLLTRKWDGRPLRLVGLGLAGVTEGTIAQLELFEERDERAACLDRAAFDAARRGLGKLTKARLVPKPTPKKLS